MEFAFYCEPWKALCVGVYVCWTVDVCICVCVSSIAWGTVSHIRPSLTRCSHHCQGQTSILRWTWWPQSKAVCGHIKQLSRPALMFNSTNIFRIHYAAQLNSCCVCVLVVLYVLVCMPVCILFYICTKTNVQVYVVCVNIELLCAIQ